MTNALVEVGDDTDAIHDVMQADVFIHGDAVNAEFPQGHGGIAEQVNALEDALGDHWLHHVQLELSGFGGHGDGDALMFGVGIVESPVIESKRLVERLNLIDDHENGEEDAAMIRKEVMRHGSGAGSSQDDHIVEDITARAISLRNSP